MLQKKMDYYYGAYGQCQDYQPLLPLSFDNTALYKQCEDFYDTDMHRENASMKWGSLAKIILNNNPQNYKNLIRSVAGDIYAKLKELSYRIQRPKFRKILKYVDDLLRTEMDVLEHTHQDESDDEKKLRTLIMLLFIIKKGKLEELITNSAEKHRRVKSTRRRSIPKIYVFPKNRKSDSIEKFSRYFPKIKKPGEFNFRSEKKVPSIKILPKSTADWGPKPIISNNKLGVQSASSDFKKSTDDSSTNFSIDSYANEELDWA